MTDFVLSFNLLLAWEYREIIEEQIKAQATGKIFYFCTEETIYVAAGRIVKMKEIKGSGIFIHLNPSTPFELTRS